MRYFHCIILLINVSIISCHEQNDIRLKRERLATLATSKIERPQYGFVDGVVDKNGVLWFASFGSGVYRLDNKGVFHITKRDGLCSDDICTIYEDQEGVLWFGTDNGICTYDGETFSHIPIPFTDTSSSWLDKVYPVINPNAVHSILQDRTGNYWIGTGGGGAYHYDGKRFTAHLRDVGVQYEDSLYHNWIPDIVEDQKGNIWFASMSHGGLTRYDGKVFKQFFREDGLSDDMVREIGVDQAGKVWLGFNGNRASSLTTYDGKSFYRYLIEESSCHKSVRALHWDKNNRLWLGGEQGICFFEKGSFSDILDVDDRAFSGITFIISDNDQNIWFGGRNGLWKYDGETVVTISP